MKEQRFTSQQITAIRTTGRDLLVAASAGTGKTTVLAQRCLYLRVHEKVPLRSVLAVTFTDAAAADMRRKIANELRDLVQQNPDDALRREMLLIDRAPISTLHSFCYKLVREHFHQLNLDPGFGIIDSDEAEILKADVADQLLERWFAREDDAGDRFFSLAEAYGGRDGQSLVREVLRLHDFLQTLPDPVTWRERVRTAYRAKGEFTALEWHAAYRKSWQRELDHCRTLANHASTLLDRVDGLEAYRPLVAAIQTTLDDWRGSVDGSFNASQWTAFLSAVRGIHWEKSPRINGATDEQKLVQEQIAALKDRITEIFVNRLAAQSPDEIVNGLREVAPLVDAFFALQQDFETEYKEAKARRWLLDFNDLERFSYELLTSRPNAARDVRRRFRHILVDEYQDINPLQDAILRNLSEGDGNHKASEVFRVGDEKQSIYGFRLAAPRLFLETLRRFSPDVQAAEVRVPLTHNFRCRREIIHAVNHIFERISSPALEGSYGDDARLTYGAEYPSSPLILEPIPVEFHLLEKEPVAESEPSNDDDPEDADAVASAEHSDLEREATLIAQRIHQLVSDHTHVWNPERTECKKARYRDMVILLRTIRKRADMVASVLRNHGIPVYADSTTGFFDAIEVRDMLALLELLDNTRQDVALAAVLRSPLVGLSDDELAVIRAHHPAGLFHDAVWSYADTGSDHRLRDKIGEFRARLDRWRDDVNQLPLARVVWDIYRVTYHLEYVQGLPGGESRRANLIRLHDRARQFDQFHQRGLFRFLRFLRRLQEAEHDFGSAPVLSESDDVVRIMSIHKSKGLEFPIVFVPDLSKPFNLRDIGDQLLFDQDLLLGIDRIDLDRMQRTPTLPKILIAEEKRREVLAEEQRLLYVALTRARERLILSGTAKMDRAARDWDVGSAASGIDILSARCVLDWLGPILARHPDTAPALGATFTPDRADESRFTLCCHSAAAIRSWAKSRENSVETGIELDAPASNVEMPVIADAIAAAKTRLEWRYPFADTTSVPGKLTVTEWKRRFSEGGEDGRPIHTRVHRQITRRPKFLAGADRRVTAAERGVATHAVLQRLDRGRPLDPAGIHAQVDSLIQRHLIGKNEARVVDVEAISAFFLRPLGIRLRHALRMQREVPFSALLDADEIPDAIGTGLPSTTNLETVLVQGVIDCLFWEDGSPILIDYKTDDISSAEIDQAVARYRIQIAIYERALRAIHGFAVRESYLVFLTARQDVRM